MGNGVVHVFQRATSFHEVAGEGARESPSALHVSRVHQLEMEVRGGRVTGVADPPDHIAYRDELARANSDAAGCQMGKQGEELFGSDDDVIPGDPSGIDTSLRRAEAERGPERAPGLPQRV